MSRRAAGDECGHRAVPLIPDLRCFHQYIEDTEYERGFREDTCPESDM